MGRDTRFWFGAGGLLAKAAEVGKWQWLDRLVFEQKTELGRLMGN